MGEAGENPLILEVGPGLGALTAPLLSRGAKVLAVELDRGLAAALEASPEAQAGSLTVRRADVLKLRAEDLPSNPSLVCGNLPYNISSPFLIWFLETFGARALGIFTLQRELAERLVASPNSREYGRLTVALGLSYAIETAFPIPSSAFSPKPKVESAAVIFRPRAEAPPTDLAKLGDFTKIAFHSRRKTLFNNLKAAYAPQETMAILARAGIDPGARPETLDPETYARLAQAFGRAAPAGKGR
jgi:16S rRNA (adenine1518-N6/adenine1519-N6)-dimethyltransferase